MMGDPSSSSRSGLKKALIEEEEEQEGLKVRWRRRNPSVESRYALLVLLLYLGAGVIAFYCTGSSMTGQKSGSPVVDALYFCVITMTTVGYGDLVPATTAAKLMTCIYLILGFGLVSALLSVATNYLVVKQERFLLKAIYRRMNGKLRTKLQKRYTERPARFKAIVSAALVVAMVAAGLLLLMTVEKKSATDSFYLVVVTMTTLGYGDHTFKTVTGRLFASCWILLSTVCVTQFFLSMAEMQSEDRQHALTSWVLSRRMSISDLDEAAIDQDGQVRASDFILYKLKELGKVDERDIHKLLTEFRKLDVDGSGTLLPSHLIPQP